MDYIDIEDKLKSEEDYSWYRVLRILDIKIIKLALKDSRQKKLTLKRHQSSHNHNRMSALVWVWVPGEGIGELFEFDNVCRRIGLDPDDVRVLFMKNMTDEEIEKYSQYRSYIID